MAGFVFPEIKGRLKLWAGPLKKFFYVVGLGFALAAVIFTLVGLSEADLNIGNWLYLFVALLCSATGFLLQGVAWGVNVKIVHQRYSLSDALQHHCSTIFLKYIPGKVAAILGRAWLASENLSVALKGLSLISLLDVIFSTVLGFFLEYYCLFCLMRGC